MGSTSILMWHPSSMEAARTLVESARPSFGTRRGPHTSLARPASATTTNSQRARTGLNRGTTVRAFGPDFMQHLLHDKRCRRVP